MRSRTAGVCTRDSSNRNALMMCVFSTVRLAVPEERGLRVVIGKALGFPSHLVRRRLPSGSGNDTKPAAPAWNGQPPPSEFGSYATRPR